MESKALLKYWSLECVMSKFSFIHFRGGHLGANEPTVALKCCFFFGSEEAP